MWCQYQNQEKTHQTLQSIAPLLSPAAFARLWNKWSITDSSGTWKETKLEWFSQRPKYHRPACTLRVFCPRGLYSEATCYCYFLWSWKGTRYSMEFWHLKRLTQCKSARPTPTFYSRFPLRQKVSSQSWWKLFQTLCTGNGHTSGNASYLLLCVVWKLTQ